MPRRHTIEDLVDEPYWWDLDHWPDVDVDALARAKVQTYRKRRQAVESYLQGVALATIEAGTGIGPRELRRLVRRCVQPRPDGLIRGFTALVPFQRVARDEIRASITASPMGYRGALNRVMARFPDLARDLEGRYNNRGGTQRKPRLTVGAIHRHFIRELVRLGVQPQEWPFTTRHEGKEALRCYLKRRAQEQGAADNQTERAPADAVPMVLRNTASRHRWPETRWPYSRVEVDAHRLDTFAVTDVTVFNSALQLAAAATAAVERPWLIAAVDCASGAIFGYELCLRPEVGQFDVLRCLRTMLVPWVPRTLSVPALAYPPGGGLPSGVIPRLAYATPDLLAFDNARANLARRVRAGAIGSLCSHVSYGPAGVPEARGAIESLFQVLASELHRLPWTTGTGPDDGQRAKDPVAAAVEFKVGLDELLQLIDVLVARHNMQRHGRAHHTPLEYLAAFSNSPASLVRTVPPDQRASLALMTDRRRVAVRGGGSTGRSPYVQYENVKYRNATLASFQAMVGKPLLIEANMDDLRCLKAYLVEGDAQAGTFFGLLWGEGAWGVKPHSLLTRQRIIKANKAHLLDLVTYADPIEAYTQWVVSQSRRSRRAASEHARLRKERSVPPGSGPSNALPASRTADSPEPETPTAQRRDWIPLDDVLD